LAGTGARTEVFADTNNRMKELTATLRNALVPIRMAVHLMRRKQLTGSEQEWLCAMLDRQSTQLVLLADDLQGVSQSAGSRLPLPELESATQRVTADRTVEDTLARRYRVDAPPVAEGDRHFVKARYFATLNRLLSESQKMAESITR